MYNVYKQLFIVVTPKNPPVWILIGPKQLRIRQCILEPQNDEIFWGQFLQLFSKVLLACRDALLLMYSPLIFFKTAVQHGTS